jgi:hypothetical protein
VRQDDLQAFLGDAGGFLFFAQQEGEERRHGLFAPEQAFEEAGLSRRR